MTHPDVHRWFLWTLSNPLCYISGLYIVLGVICLCSVLRHIIICRGMKTECINNTYSLWQRTFNLTLIPFCGSVHTLRQIKTVFVLQQDMIPQRYFAIIYNDYFFQRTSKVRALAEFKKPNYVFLRIWGLNLVTMYILLLFINANISNVFFIFLLKWLINEEMRCCKM